MSSKGCFAPPSFPGSFFFSPPRIRGRGEGGRGEILGTRLVLRIILLRLRKMRLASRVVKYGSAGKRCKTEPRTEEYASDEKLSKFSNTCKALLKCHTNERAYSDWLKHDKPLIFPFFSPLFLFLEQLQAK